MFLHSNPLHPHYKLTLVNAEDFSSKIHEPNYSKLFYDYFLQLNLFEEPEQQISEAKIDYVVDAIRKKYGFKSIDHAHSLLKGGRAIARSGLVGGHAGGMSGIEGKQEDKKKNSNDHFHKN